MSRLMYQAVKITLGVVVAIFVAEIVGLKYPTTAGIIAMLSLLDSRRQTYVIGIKRMITAIIAIILSSLVFHIGGHHLLFLGLFLLIFVPMVTLLKSTEGLTMSTVLVTHIYTLQTLGVGVALNEIGLLLIGIGVAWVLNLHMPNLSQEIKGLQKACEEQIIGILMKMKMQLLNQCSLDDQISSLENLDQLLTKGMDRAIIYNNNYLLKDNSYYIRYFQMRRQQYFVLLHMANHFKRRIFVEIEKAKPISEFTDQLAKTFNEKNLGQEALEEAGKLLTYYRNSDLPKTREAFEDRATLFQYLNDIIYLIEIKAKFMTVHGILD